MKLTTYDGATTPCTQPWKKNMTKMGKDDTSDVLIESTKTTSMENFCTGVLGKNTLFKM